MLILGRCIGQKIVINGDLILTILQVNHKSHGLEIELGFEGCKDKYIIDREELHERKQKGLKND